MTFLCTNFSSRILKLSNGVKHIGMHVFDESSLTDVYIPDSVEQSGAFSNVKYHMAKSVFGRLELDLFYGHDNRIVIEPNLAEFIEAHTFKELNDRNLKAERILETGLIPNSIL